MRHFLLFLRVLSMHDFVFGHLKTSVGDYLGVY